MTEVARHDADLGWERFDEEIEKASATWQRIINREHRKLRWLTTQPSRSAAIVANPIPLQELLDCPEDKIPAVGRKTVSWLERQPDRAKVLLLSRLAREVSSRVSSGCTANDVAAIELLSRYDIAIPDGLLVSMLQCRPLSHLHSFIVQLVSRVGGGSIDETGDELCGLLRDATALDEYGNDWQRVLVVECCRALEPLAPARLVAVLAEVLEQLNELELTAVVEHLTTALAKLDTVPPALGTAVDAVVSRIGLSDNALNRNGILARLLEIEMFTHTVDEIVGKCVRLSNGGDDVLYLLSQRPLVGVNPDSRRSLYVATLRALKEHDRRTSLLALFERIARDRDVDTYEMLRHAFV